jgi:hydrogenase-4 transcriptional activator
MTAHAPLRLMRDVWREVSRHVEIDESVHGLFVLVARELPIDWCFVRSVAADRGRLDTLGAGGEAGSLPVPARTEVPPEARGALSRFLDQRGVRHFGPSGRDPVRDLLAPLPGHLVAGPLYDGDELIGVVVFGGVRDPSAGAALIEDLLEPFATAVVNDRRLNELARLREAAEADRRALLSRLQRQDVSDAVIGAEAGLRTVMERIEQVARTDAPVLILGETGSGKEVAARAIHTRSRRAEGPFLRVNCGAIPAELVDSELFGHERGSFTGAVSSRKGWFERADGGTLFLDEIGELPAAAQVRLLRVLQDGTFQRVGGQQSLTVDVRIVAATHRDLRAHVREGSFREDLWYRISVFPIALPPLRERREDIPAMVRHFAARAGERLHGKPIVPSHRDTELLASYAWPGNVRELAAVIERAAILGDGRHLEVRAALGVLADDGPAASNGGGEDKDEIVAAVARCRGRIEGPFGAAAALGVNPHTLRSRMRRLGIEWSQYRSKR